MQIGTRKWIAISAPQRVSEIWSPPYFLLCVRAGFSGAQLANLVNEAALMAGRTDVTEVSLVLLEDARDKILMGAQRKSLVQSLADRRMTAYHESGHAIVALNNHGALSPELILPTMCNGSVRRKTGALIDSCGRHALNSSVMVPYNMSSFITAAPTLCHTSWLSRLCL